MQSVNTNSDGSQVLPPFFSSTIDSSPISRFCQRSPEKSVMSHFHNPTHQDSPQGTKGSVPSEPNHEHATSSPSHGSSDESHKTSPSDAKKWFDHSNQNPAAILKTNVMDVDPPFFQKESDSSNEDRSYLDQPLPPPKLGQDHSSSVDDYRSVIDDLTIEIQKLKDELKKYKRQGPEMLRSEKLFEIKIHGLPKSKKQELEATLRHFATTLDESPVTSCSQHKKPSKQTTSHHMFLESRSISASKHASSSSGSNFRQGDSAYASISTGANSVGNSLSRPLANSRLGSSDHIKVENYLRDIPKGLYPRHVAMTEKEKKKLVVRRLEQIFTGKISGRHSRRSETYCELGSATGRRGAATTGSASVLAPAENQPMSHAGEPSREAQIVPLEHDPRLTCKSAWSRDVTSGSDSNGDGDYPELAGNSSHVGNGSRTRPDLSSAVPSLPEQRPTRLKDLDPDRVQIPSENMEYMRHLGLDPLEPVLPSPCDLGHDVHVDADGWVYLNLLCNMAQLHIMNVTPDFVRAAVTELSAKFQLSPDGGKIRWRGGTEGTIFSSDSSGRNSQRSAETDDTETSMNGARKWRKIDRSTGDSFHFIRPAKNLPSVRIQRPSSSESFHYQPLFVHYGSPHERVFTENDTWSSFGPAKNSSHDGSLGWHTSGSLNASNGRKRRHDGTIIYYSGAPFCTDLSGDPGDVSPMAFVLSSRRVRAASSVGNNRPLFLHPESELESLEAGRPLSDGNLQLEATPNLQKVEDNLAAELDHGEGSESDWELPWSNGKQLVDVRPLEPSGLGGVLPEDHFMVIVTTERPKYDAMSVKPERLWRGLSEEATGSIISLVAAMSPSSRQLVKRSPGASGRVPLFEIRYVLESTQHLAPEQLPPAAIFLPPLSVDSGCEEDEDEIATEDDDDGVA